MTEKLKEEFEKVLNFHKTENIFSGYAAINYLIKTLEICEEKDICIEIENFFNDFRFNFYYNYCYPIFSSNYRGQIELFNYLRNNSKFDEIIFCSFSNYSLLLCNNLKLFLEKPNFVNSLKIRAVISSNWNNRIDDTKLKIIAESIKTNNSLSFIDLAESNISDVGVEYLKMCIKCNINHRIKYINLPSCQIENKSTFLDFDNIQLNTANNPCTRD